MTAIDAPRAGRREWVGLAVLALACLLYVMDLTVLQIGVSNGLAVIVIGSIVISLGLAPVLSLTTELIVGSAPPERAGAASGISETASEFGGALGLWVLGSIGVALYRGDIATGLPAGVSGPAATIARDTLGGAVEVAGQLPGQLGTAVFEVARNAFIHGMQVVYTIGAILAVGIAILAVVMLRNVGSGADREAASDAEAEADRPDDTERPRHEARPTRVVTPEA